MPLDSSAPSDLTARMQRMAASPRLAMASRRMGLNSVKRDSEKQRAKPAGAQATTSRASTIRAAPIPHPMPSRRHFRQRLRGVFGALRHGVARAVRRGARGQRAPTGSEAELEVSVGQSAANRDDGDRAA